MRPYPDVSETLTRDELARPFLVADIDATAEPLPLPARVGLQWHGDAWAEIDPETGDVLATGSAGSLDCRSCASADAAWAPEGARNGAGGMP